MFSPDPLTALLTIGSARLDIAPGTRRISAVLRIWLFGRVRFQIEGHPVVAIKPERAQRLLAWLALEAREGEGQPGTQARKRIVRSLWPTSDAGRPDNSLDQALRELRAAMGESYERYIVRDGDRLGLAAGVWVDAHEFDRLVDRDPTQALRLSEHSFLEWVTRSGSAWDHRSQSNFASRRSKLQAQVDASEGSPVGGQAPKQPAPNKNRHRSGRRPSLGLLGSGVLVLGVAGASALSLATLGEPPNPASAPCPAGLTEADTADAGTARASRNPTTPRRLPAVDVGARPAALAVAREGIWVAERAGVVLIDPKQSKQASPVIAVADEGATPQNAAFSIAVAKERLWVSRRDGVLVSVDRDTRRLVGRPIRYGGGAATVATGYGAVWINNFNDDFEGHVTRVDPCTSRLSRIRVGRGANTVYFAYGSLWVTNSVDGTIERIDPRSGRKVASITGLDDPQDLVAANGSLWVTEYGSQRIRQVDPRDNRILRQAIKVGPDPAGLTAAAGALWVAHYGNGTLTRVDLRSRRARLRIVSGGTSPTDVVAGFGRLWTPNNDGDTVTPIRP